MKASDGMFNGIYIDLDFFLDTRLSFLKDIYPKAIQQMLEDQSYYTRTCNEFMLNGKKMPVDFFNNLFKLRNKMVLKDALPTTFLYFLGHLFADAEDNYKEDNQHVPTTLFINTFPYNFTDDDVIHFLMFIKSYVPNIVDIKFIHLPLAEITADKLVDMRLREIYMYNGIQWLEYLIGTRQHVKYQLGGTILYCAKIFSPKSLLGDPNSNSYDEIKELSKSILRVDFIDMNILSARAFWKIDFEEYFS